MHFLADESCDFAVVRALRRAGHDVLAIQETGPGSSDEEVLRLDLEQSRMLLTEDKDFDRLFYATTSRRGGVVFLRFPANAREQIAEATVRLVAARGEDLLGRFVVTQPGRIRISGRSADR
ncbi:MAG: DUF5615 family PIN-like protein [Planctomycetota bacterium]